MKRIVILLALVGIVLAILQKRPGIQTLIEGRAMGCDWKLLTDERVDPEQLRGEVASVIERWEQVLSTWRPDSDLSRFNKGEPVTPDLRRVIDLAELLSEKSDGAFDHRMLLQLGEAGFGPGGKGVDLSSVGKGFAVDRVAERLRYIGVRRFVFSIAGEVRAGEGEWPVGIESPASQDHSVVETLMLSKSSMATSGNSRQSRGMEGGRIISHILNPATGTPVLRPPCSVTVIGPDAAIASGWATAMFVRGKKGEELLAGTGYRAIWHGPSGPLTE